MASFGSLADAQSAAETVSRRIDELPRLGRCGDCDELVEDVPRTRCECDRLLCEACCVHICDHCNQHWCGECLCDLDHEHIEDWEPIRGLFDDHKGIIGDLDGTMDFGFDDC